MEETVSQLRRPEKGECIFVEHRPNYLFETMSHISGNENYLCLQ